MIMQNTDHDEAYNRLHWEPTACSDSTTPPPTGPAIDLTKLQSTFATRGTSRRAKSSGRKIDMTAITEARSNLAEAQEALDAAKSVYEAAQKVERDATRIEQLARYEQSYQNAISVPDSAYMLDTPDDITAAYGDVRPYVLPFGREYGKWNPMDVDNAAFGKDWLGNTTAIICQRLDEARTRPSRLIFTSGVGPCESDKIGQVFTARHNQTNAELGVYQIVGLVIYDPSGDVARIVGDVPNIKYSQNTYK